MDIRYRIYSNLNLKESKIIPIYMQSLATTSKGDDGGLESRNVKLSADNSNNTNLSNNTKLVDAVSGVGSTEKVFDWSVSSH